jgi:hypothetical protein
MLLMFRGTKPASLHVPPSSSSQRYVKKETNQLSPVKKRIKENKDHYIGKLHPYQHSVADPGCLSRIRPFSIRIFSSRIRIKNFSILTQKMFSKL